MTRPGKYLFAAEDGCGHRKSRLSVLLAEFTVALEEGPQHVRNEVGGLLALPISDFIGRRVIGECLLEIGHHLEGQLDRLAVGKHCQLEIGHLSLAKAKGRSEEHKYELQSLMRISYAVFCLKT